MSEIQENIDALGHMDAAFSEMRQAIGIIRERNESMVQALTVIWGEGNDKAKGTIGQLAAAETKLRDLDTSLFQSQVLCTHALVHLSRAAGGDR